MKFFVICILYACCAAADEDINIRYRSYLVDEDKENGLEITRVSMHGCTELPCKLIKGENTTLSIEFTAVKDEVTFKDKCWGRVLGIWIPFNLPEEENCKATNLCPLMEGESYVYEYSIPVESWYPSMSLPIRWALEREDGSEALRIVFPAKIE